MAFKSAVSVGTVVVFYDFHTVEYITTITLEIFKLIVFYTQPSLIWQWGLIRPIFLNTYDSQKRHPAGYYKTLIFRINLYFFPERDSNQGLRCNLLEFDCHLDLSSTTGVSAFAHSTTAAGDKENI